MNSARKLLREATADLLPIKIRATEEFTRGRLSREATQDIVDEFQDIDSMLSVSRLIDLAYKKSTKADIKSLLVRWRKLFQFIKHRIKDQHKRQFDDELAQHLVLKDALVFINKLISESPKDQELVDLREDLKNRFAELDIRIKNFRGNE